MNPIRCYIVDDEPPAIALISKYIEMTDMLVLVGTSLSAVKAYDDIIKEDTIDLLFLDIQMPVLNGLDLIKTLKNPPSIILTTAYREYALDGYDLDIIDYLLKPISFDRFLKSITRYQSRRTLPYTNTTSGVSKAEVPHLFFNINKTNHKVMKDDILYIESLKDYVRIHLAQNTLVVKGNLGSIMKLLPDDRFVRIHRSFAVAIDKVMSYNQTSLTVNENHLLIGASYREKVILRLRAMS